MSTARCRFLSLRGAAAVLLALLLIGCDDPAPRDGSSGSSGVATGISATEAASHVGSRQPVCGDVKSPKYEQSSRGRPTFLNLDRPYPNQVFTVVIWGEHRGNFPQRPEAMYDGKSICATGLIGSFQGVPQIEISAPSQISIR